MSQDVIGPLQSSPIVRRHPGNPILSARDVPYESSLVFNAGVAKFAGRYVMVFRDDHIEGNRPGGRNRTNLGLATSADGVRWQVAPRPCLTTEGAQRLAGAFYGNRGPEEVHRAYDPRLTVMDGRCYMCFALDTAHGIRGCVAVTDDFDRWECLSLSVPDNRNMVLFPQKVGDRYVRLERPFPVYSRRTPETFDCWISFSHDLRYWGDSDLVLGVEDVPFANRKIGPAAPPVRTPKGWLTLFHAVDFDPSRGKNGWEEKWQKRYTIGVMLLDLEGPGRVVGLCRQPLLVPEEPYECTEGYRTNVLFPGGMILEAGGEVKIYYGAADTVECLATADVGDLLRLCGA